MSLEFLRLGYEARGVRGVKPKFILLLTLIPFLFRLLETLISLWCKGDYDSSCITSVWHQSSWF